MSVIRTEWNFVLLKIILSSRIQIDEISRTVREVDKLFGQSTILPVKSTTPQKATVLHSLLTVQHKNLNPSYEMKRMFGSKVVQAEQYEILWRKFFLII